MVMNTTVPSLGMEDSLVELLSVDWDVVADIMFLCKLAGSM